MDAKLSPVRAVIQRVFTLSKEKDAIEQPTATNLTVPLWNTLWHSGSNPSVEGSIVATLSPRSLPSYVLAPQRNFDFSRAQKLLHFELQRRCNKIAKTFHYEAKFANDFARELSQQLRRILKLDHLFGQRYKFIVLASVVQVAPNRQIHQSVIISSRCLWSRDTDGSITVQSKLGQDMMTIVTAFAIYTD